ncbi:MFS transporter, partial [Chloroflexota bacterium]
LIARILLGWLADIFPKKYVLAISIALTSAGLFLFWLIDGSSFISMIMFAIILGAGLGGSIVVRTPLLGEYFGTKNFGTIYGSIGFFSMIGLVVYPPVAGWVYDTLGIYDPIWLVFGGGCTIGVISMLTIPPTRKLIT